MLDIIRQGFDESIRVKRECRNRLPKKIEILVQKMIVAYENDSKCLFFGNGGSAADAQHAAGELIGHFDLDRLPIPAIALTTDTSVITCISNDYSNKNVFSRQVAGLGLPGDIAIGFSTSGNSKNVVNVIEKSGDKALYTVAFTGQSGGKLRDRVDLLINVPSTSTPRIQECHITIIHILCKIIEEKLFMN